MPKVRIDSIDLITRATLLKCGVPLSSIEIILDTIHYADRRGIPTHGIGRLPLYVKKIMSGHFNPKDETITLIDSDAIAVLDAKCGFGQVAAKHAVDLAIEKAAKFGVAVVSVCNSNNFGTAGYYGDYVAREGMAALVFANAAPAIMPTGGNRTIFGTNPICCSFPGNRKRFPIVLDMATTIASRGKIRLAAKNKEQIPFDWAVDKNGQPTDDPNEALRGALLPIAGYKGYALSLFVDLFAGLLTGAAYAGDVKMLSDMNEDSRNGHLFIIIDVTRFMTEDELNEKLDRFYDSVKACGDRGKVMLPGERGYQSMEQHTDTVIISDKQIKELNELVESMGISSKLEAIEDEQEH